MSKHNIRVDAIGLAAEVVELRNEIARLKGQTNWVCQCGGTDCKGQKENAELRAHAERVGQANDRLAVENADLHATLDAIIAADERAVKVWRAAHPGNELVIPDRGKLVGWLLEQNAELRSDKERLDWLITNKHIRYPFFPADCYLARSAIDAARSEAQA